MPVNRICAGPQKMFTARVLNDTSNVQCVHVIAV